MLKRDKEGERRDMTRAEAAAKKKAEVAGTGERNRESTLTRALSIVFNLSSPLPFLADRIYLS